MRVSLVSLRKISILLSEEGERMPHRKITDTKIQQCVIKES